MDDIVRVTGKKIDDLQEVIAACRDENFGIALAICQHEIGSSF
jgi:uncharacterized protein YajQ (UPF0234 family)